MTLEEFIEFVTLAGSGVVSTVRSGVRTRPATAVEEPGW